MKLTGIVTDLDTDTPLQGATITVTDANGDSTGIATTSNAAGRFILDNPQVKEGNKAVVTFVEYEPLQYSLEDYDEDIYFQLKKTVKELPPVVVTGSSSNIALLGLGALLLVSAKTESQRRIGTITTGNLMTVGVGIALFLGFDVVKKLFEGVGLWDSPETKNVENEINNPGSAFNPNFWKTAPSGSLLLTFDQVVSLGSELLSSFGAFGDDEAQAIGVFKKMKTKSQVSYFADMWAQNAGGNLWSNKAGSDLLVWLQGNGWPNDRLDNDEINTIIQYVNKLPNYKP